MKKPIQELTLLPEDSVEIKFPEIPDIYVVVGFYKGVGFDGYWNLFKMQFESQEEARKFCHSKTRAGWLCFKIFNLNERK